MTAASKVKSGVKTVKAATKKAVRKAGKLLKPVSDALHITSKRDSKSTGPKNCGNTRRTAKSKAR